MRQRSPLARHVRNFLFIRWRAILVGIIICYVRVLHAAHVHSYSPLWRLLFGIAEETVRAFEVLRTGTQGLHLLLLHQHLILFIVIHATYHFFWLGHRFASLATIEDPRAGCSDRQHD